MIGDDSEAKYRLSWVLDHGFIILGFFEAAKSQSSLEYVAMVASINWMICQKAR